eukprot:CAMPEP_0115167146 /NCGR_PEP_ID=MMETSP0270-20121206/59_1 /TAXON_ID=71861 /ORGANISM="Scrippsiella trochoidea, Strain CCMP3099" /LENGTH=35 /DNA_ID= /DNA_START= /DNA_END= /DNA_ORIENTATION=
MSDPIVVARLGACTVSQLGIPSKNGKMGPKRTQSH